MCVTIVVKNVEVLEQFDLELMVELVFTDLNANNTNNSRNKKNIKWYKIKISQ